MSAGSLTLHIKTGPSYNFDHPITFIYPPQ
jgi:hypothetical protein